MKDTFRRFAHKTSELVGAPPVFIIAVMIIIVWGILGPYYNYSDTWQLIINTGTTIVTFLMVFLIQNTQNRDAKAIHLKLDELLRALNGARTDLVNLENFSEEELKEVQKEFEELQKHYSTHHEKILKEFERRKKKRK
ncbi:low affinity iron permease family protein [bacterium]|nr:low affinity iron permease family protein [bacterium]